MTSKERAQNILQEHTTHITPVVDKIERFNTKVK
jgi:hypothetical protein